MGKKYKEGAGRTWFEFGLDSSKQLLGAGWIHVSNMLCAIIFAGRLTGKDGAIVDACAWYAANIIVDTTVGVFVEWVFLLVVMKLVLACSCASIARMLESGSYYNENNEFELGRYVSQLVVWLGIVTAMKVCVVTFMRGCPVVVFAISSSLKPVEENPQVKLFVVMIIVPLMMNTFQLLVTDNFIKKKVAARELRQELLVKPAMPLQDAISLHVASR